MLRYVFMQKTTSHFSVHHVVGLYTWTIGFDQDFRGLTGCHSPSTSPWAVHAVLAWWPWPSQLPRDVRAPDTHLPVSHIHHYAFTAATDVTDDRPVWTQFGFKYRTTLQRCGEERARIYTRNCFHLVIIPRPWLLATGAPLRHLYGTFSPWYCDRTAF